MGYLALYRKYRPKNFNDLVGQQYVSKIIRDEIVNNRISHAYLFSGPRGTGKTSTAKIMAKMVNCLDLSKDGTPCNKCINCLNVNNNDIVEIDAASNNGVDEIRELRDKANLVPTSGKYKVYIIDEVHMLTTQAFNALLKILEEPPNHIIFILATTELHKIPITVVSRCQKFRFNKFSNDEIFSRLSNIVKLEGISITDDSLYEIARLSDGGLRDAINMLDQLSSYKSSIINIEDVYNLNGVVSYKEFYEFLVNVIDGNNLELINFIQEIDNAGNSIVRFLQDFMIFLKDVLLYLKTSNYESGSSYNNEFISLSSKLLSLSRVYDLIFDINDLINKIKNSSFSVILAITYFLNLSLSFNDGSAAIENSLSLNYNENRTELNKKDENKYENQKIKMEFFINDDVKKVRINNTFATASKKNKDYMLNNWNCITDKLIDEKYGAIAALLKDTEILVVGEGYLMILVKYDSLMKRLYNKFKLIEELFFVAFDVRYKIVFLNSDEWNYEKNKFIDNKKNGIVYKLLEEEINFSNAEADRPEKNDCSNEVDRLISIFGDDVIEYK